MATSILPEVGPSDRAVKAVLERRAIPGNASEKCEDVGVLQAVARLNVFGFVLGLPRGSDGKRAFKSRAA